MRGFEMLGEVHVRKGLSGRVVRFGAGDACDRAGAGGCLAWRAIPVRKSGGTQPVLSIDAFPAFDPTTMAP